MELGDHDLFKRLDEIERNGGTMTGVVSSYHGPGDDKCLIHARFYNNFAEVADLPWPIEGSILAPDLHPFIYTDWSTSDLKNRAKLFKEQSVGSWHHYTLYDSKTVPMEIIEKMRVAQRMSKEGWEKRGVKVGKKKAWGILQRWYDRLG